MHIVAIGGSDAGISAALRAREVDPGAEVTVVVADAYPNFSICGIPYYVSGEVTHWRNLAHRTYADLEAAGMRLRLDTTARKVDVAGRLLHADRAGRRRRGRDRRMTSWSSAPARSPSARRSPGLDGLGPARRGAPAALDGRHLRHHADPGGGRPGQRGDRRRRATSAWRWPRRCPPAAWPSPRSSSCPRCCPPSTRNSARWSAPSWRPRRRPSAPAPTSRAISPRRARRARDGCGSTRSTADGEPVSRARRPGPRRDRRPPGDRPGGQRGRPLGARGRHRSRQGDAHRRCRTSTPPATA